MRNNLTYRPYQIQPVANLAAVNPFIGLCQGQDWKGHDIWVSQNNIKDTDVG
jgi:hypothetical protein